MCGAYKCSDLIVLTFYNINDVSTARRKILFLRTYKSFNEQPSSPSPSSARISPSQSNVSNYTSADNASRYMCARLPRRIFDIKILYHHYGHRCYIRCRSRGSRDRSRSQEMADECSITMGNLKAMVRHSTSLYSYLAHIFPPLTQTQSI